MFGTRPATERGDDCDPRIGAPLSRELRRSTASLVDPALVPAGGHGMVPGMTVTSTRFRISVAQTGHAASPWRWSIYRYGMDTPLMRSTAMFAKRSEAETAGREAVTGLRLTKQRQDRQARL